VFDCWHCSDSISGTPVEGHSRLFKGWLGVENRSHHHMERAERTGSCWRACKDEMMGCVYNRKCYLSGPQEDP
jgi:hypothetical protein